MSAVGQKERHTQNQFIRLFCDDLGYRYLGDWHEREGNLNIEEGLLTTWLKGRGISDTLIKRTIRRLDAAAALGEGMKLFDANKMCIACCVMA